jgi:uncharacterized protein
MANRMLGFKLIVVLFAIIIDLYAFVALSAILKEQSYLVRVIPSIVFWLVTVAFIVTFLLVFRIDTGNRNPASLSGAFLMIGVFILLYFPKLVFLTFRGAEDIIWAGSYVAKIFARLFTGADLSTVRLGILSKTGLMISILPFIAVLWGMVFGRFHYQVEQVEIRFKNLPDALNGITLVQISDAHLGSMHGKEKKFDRVVKIINDLKPDLIFFTGDLVNNFTEEAYTFEKEFASMQARYGKFSILGNHDYGEYWDWKSDRERLENMQRLYEVHQKMGFTLLLNAWDTVSINHEKLAIIGVENWGLPPFKQYGDLDKAMKGIPDSLFKILLSHDPTHWDAKVIDKTDIPLTLSGHTHGMQFGVRLGKFRWSPSKYIYKRWMGIYQDKDQILYVNRGLGFLGFPGRIGLRPEITYITLRKSPE